MHTHVVTDILHFLHLHQQIINTKYRGKSSVCRTELPQAVSRSLNSAPYWAKHFMTTCQWPTLSSSERNAQCGSETSQSSQLTDTY